MLLEDVGDFPIRVALAAKLSYEVAVGLQARAHRVIGSGFEEVFSLLIHVGFLTSLLVNETQTKDGHYRDERWTNPGQWRTASGCCPVLVRMLSVLFRRTRNR
jgi:hypothetical protein